MKTYELTYIISPEITSEEAGAVAKGIESAITGREGIILKQSVPTAKTLSYPVGKHASGFFGVIEFQLEPEKMAELKEILAKDGKIVRHMVIIKEAAEMKKERRTRTKSAMPFSIEKKSGEPSIAEDPNETKQDEHLEKSAPKTKEGKGRVELKDIEQELDEILG